MSFQHAYSILPSLAGAYNPEQRQQALLARQTMLIQDLVANGVPATLLTDPVLLRDFCRVVQRLASTNADLAAVAKHLTGPPVDPHVLAVLGILSAP